MRRRAAINRFGEDWIMANTPKSPCQGSSRGTRGMRWMSERQLDAYLQARDALRRVRAAATVASPELRRGASPPASAV
jgi:hypothetical protein